MIVWARAPSRPRSRARRRCAGAVGLLLLVMRPLEAAAGRIANAAMPHVQDTDEYRTVRKREVYRAAVERALQDGEVSEKERDVLAALAQELGLGPKGALDVERDARGARPVGPAKAA